MRNHQIPVGESERNHTVEISFCFAVLHAVSVQLIDTRLADIQLTQQSIYQQDNLPLGRLTKRLNYHIC